MRSDGKRNLRPGKQVRIWPHQTMRDRITSPVLVKRCDRTGSSPPGSGPVLQVLVQFWSSSCLSSGLWVWFWSSLGPSCPSDFVIWGIQSEMSYCFLINVSSSVYYLVAYGFVLVCVSLCWAFLVIIVYFYSLFQPLCRFPVMLPLSYFIAVGSVILTFL